MKRIFIYEHLTGGGLFEQPALPQSLLLEGVAMLQAVTEDFLSIGCQVDVVIDARVLALQGNAFSGDPRLPSDAHVHHIHGVDERVAMFSALAAESEWSLIIAPETDGVLSELQNRVTNAGGQLLGTNQRLTRLASSKSATAEFLTSHGIPVPTGCRVGGTQDILARFELFPAVLKPDDGCGSAGVRRIADHAELCDTLAAPTTDVTTQWRIEQYIPGVPASVSVILGPNADIILPPCIQHLGGESGFEFQRCEPMAAPHLSRRAKLLAARVAKALRSLNPPPSLGWLGIDMVLSDSEFSHENREHEHLDVVVELNPRLTSSYVMLREYLGREHDANLVEIMLNAAAGLCSASRALA